MSAVHYHLYDLPAGAVPPGALALDTETLGLNLHRDRLCVVQLKGENSDTHLVHFPEGRYDAPNLRALLAHPDTTLICHYARFDLAHVYQTFKAMPQTFCTKIASKFVRTYSDRHGLKELCRELLAIDLDKGQQSSYWGNATLTEAQKAYAAQDVLHLHALRNRLLEMAERETIAPMIIAACNFLPTRVLCDLAGWEEMDIFAHS